MKRLNEFELAEIATPVGNPDVGSGFVYLKSNGLIYRKDESGTERLIGDQASTVSTYWYTADEYGMTNDGVTDNTAALQALIDLIAATEKNSVIYFSKPGTYYFNSPLTDTAGGNAVIFFPTETITDVQYTITLKGYIRPTFSPSVYSATPLPSATILRIADIAKANGGGAFLGCHVTDPTISYVVPGLEDLIIATAVDPKITAVDFSAFTCTFIKDVAIVAGTTQDALNSTQPTHTNSYGFKQPDDSHGINQRVEGVLNIFGFYNGAQIGEGAMINDIGLWACKYGLVYNFAYGASEIGRCIIGWCPVGILVNGVHNINIRQFSSEHYLLNAAKWFYYVKDIQDVGNNGYGHIEWLAVEANVGLTNTFIKDGGTGIFTNQLGLTDINYTKLTVTSKVVGGAASNVGIQVVNNNNGTETALSGNVGVYSYMDSTTVGTNTSFFTYNINRGSGASIGTAGFSNAGFGTGKKIGVLGRVSSATTLAVGGYFDINSGGDVTVPTVTTAALIANNANMAAPIFLGQDAGATVFKIDDGGDVTASRIGIGVAPSSWLLDIKGTGLQISGNFYSNFRSVNSTPDRGFYFGYDNTVAGSGIIASNSDYLGFWTYNGAAWGERMRISPAGRLGVGEAVPTAIVHIKAGTSVASTAPLKLTAGTLLATKEAGTIEHVTGAFVLQSDALRLQGSANNRVTNQRVLYGATTDAVTAVELTLDGAAGSGSTNRIAVPVDCAMSVVVNICVKQSSSANSKQMLRQFLITNNAGTTTIEGTVTALGTDVGSAGLTTCTTTITANNTDDCIKIEVNGVAATALRWSAYVVSTETIY